ncbi:hypothetical protein Nepgr_029802 [Nepenthes gracilis]|uniref:RPA-interacting protein n=1 Tax=Nepenthes gracilis TaxID=150966 RepID=A0AAD3Y5G0_NEPGR|nr:hypothetical protein Nepgr_029802 [Nepenthes gracilis]
MGEDNGGFNPSRSPLKTHNHYKLNKKILNLNWKEKLRESCHRRVREDRTRLLWKMRRPLDGSRSQKEFMKSALQDIMSDELKKVNNSSGDLEVASSISVTNDDLWEYNGLHTAYHSECEEILLEMQRIFYEDMKAEATGREHESCVIWEDEEDEYLARTVFRFMQLNDTTECKEQTWCPICKKGELLENRRLIYCSLCQFQLNRGDEVNLGIVRVRLAKAYEEHLNKGCRSKPEFCIETIFDLTALYLRCRHCDAFEVVI